jgi:hypothetical protein
MLQGFARCEPLCLEYPHIHISECLNPVEVIYQTALATIRTGKDLSLVSIHLKCLTLLTAENVHDQNQFEAKHGCPFPILVSLLHCVHAHWTSVVQHLDDKIKKLILHLVFFCNLTRLLACVPDSKDVSKVQIQIHAFL